MNIINCNQLFDQLINFIDLKIFHIAKYVRPLYFLYCSFILPLYFLYLLLKYRQSIINFFFCRKSFVFVNIKKYYIYQNLKTCEIIFKRKNNFHMLNQKELKFLVNKNLDTHALIQDLM